MATKNKAIAQILALFIVPMIAFQVSSMPLQYNIYGLILVTLAVLVIVKLEKISAKELGIRTDKIKDSLLYYAILVLVTVPFIIFLAKLLGNNTQDIFQNPHFKYGFIVMSFFQEFLFRSFLIPKLQSLTKSLPLIVLGNGLIFGLAHLTFPNPIQIFVLSSILGMAFAYVYIRKPNLILATIAHSIINFVAVYYCFASINQICS